MTCRFGFFNSSAHQYNFVIATTGATTVVVVAEATIADMIAVAVEGTYNYWLLLLAYNLVVCANNHFSLINVEDTEAVAEVGTKRCCAFFVQSLELVLCFAGYDAFDNRLRRPCQALKRAVICERHLHGGFAL